MEQYRKVYKAWIAGLLMEKIDWNNPEEVRGYRRERDSTPEAKARKREYNQRPDVKARVREYYKSPDVISRRKKYYQSAESKTKKKKFRDRLEIKKRDSELQKKYRQRPEIKDKIKKYMREYRDNPEVKVKEKQYRDKPETKAIAKKYRQNPEVKIKARKYDKKYRQIPEVNIKRRLRCRLLKVFQLYIDNGKIMSSDEYGINYNAILEHLKPFPKNRHLYHIDHIKPLCSFNFINKDGTQNLEEIEKAFAPENHQWLLSKDNLSKGGKWGTAEQIKYLLF